jgi:hypothetical protein
MTENVTGILAVVIIVRLMLVMAGGIVHALEYVSERRARKRLPTEGPVSRVRHGAAATKTRGSIEELPIG